MKVSIIIPVYNAEKTINKCFKSILRQTSDEWEVIAINDGSQDGSQKVIEQYAHKYPDKFFCFSQENAGVANTRNRGVREAHGEYIMFVDNDDFIEKDYVETFLKAIESSDYDCVVGGFRRVNDQRKILQQYKPISEWTQYAILEPWARIIRRDFILENQVEFLDYKLGEDLYFNMSLYHKTKKVKRLRYVGYNWYYNNESVSNTEHKGLRKTCDPIVLLDRIYEVTEGNLDALHQYWYVKFAVWYMCYSGRDASKKDFMAEKKRLFDWLADKGISVRFPLISKTIKGEPMKHRLVILAFLALNKLHLLNVFATLYCEK